MIILRNPLALLVLNEFDGERVPKTSRWIDGTQCHAGGRWKPQGSASAGAQQTAAVLVCRAGRIPMNRGSPIVAASRRWSVVVLPGDSGDRRPPARPNSDIHPVRVFLG